MKVERTDQQRRHHDAGHQRTGDDPASSPGRPSSARAAGATGARVGTHEEHHGDERPNPRPDPERAAPGQCQPVAEQRRHQQQQTGEREASLGRARLIPGQIAPGTPQRQQRQGSSSRKGACQPNPPINRPPKEGPSAVPQADRVPSNPMLQPRRASTSSPAMASESTSMQAAPAPCRVRAAMSQPMEGARAHSREASAKTPVPRAAGDAAPDDPRACPPPPSDW